MVFGSESSGSWRGHEDGAHMKKSSALMKETPQSSLAPFSMWGHLTTQKM